MSILSWLFSPKREAPASTSASHPSPVPMYRRLPPLPVGRFRFVALDVETANSDVGSICQIGIAFVDSDNAITTWSTLIDPCDDFDEGNIAIHRITPKDVIGAPTFDTALPFVSKILTGNPVFQHSNFDRRAIEAACGRIGISAPLITWSDSVVVARRAWPELRGNDGHGLASLKKHLDLEFEHHDAGEDARACAEVVLRAEAATSLPYSDILSGRRRTPTPMPSPAKVNPDGALTGETVVFTGALTIKRADAAGLAAAQGMSVARNVTKKTTLLVVGDQDISGLAGHEKSSRHRKAEDLITAGQNIRIIGQSEFLNLVSADVGPAASMFNAREYLRKRQQVAECEEIDPRRR